MPAEGFVIQVYTRLDAVRNDPAVRARTFGRLASATAPPIPLRLYVRTAGVLRGDMYDPIFKDTGIRVDERGGENPPLNASARAVPIASTSN